MESEVAVRGSKTLLESTDLQQYIFDTSVYPREHQQLRELRKATLDMFGSLGELFSLPADEGAFLSMVLKLMNAKKTLEIGVFTGYSLLTTALALPLMITAIDMDRESYRVGLPFIEKAGVLEKINFIQSDAISILEELLKDEKSRGAFDFVFIDADKQNYRKYHEMAIQLVRVGGAIAYDNTLWFGTVAIDERKVIEFQSRKTGQKVPRNFIDDRAHIMELNSFLASDRRVEVAHISIGDGLTLCRRLH